MSVPTHADNTQQPRPRAANPDDDRPTLPRITDPTYKPEPLLIPRDELRATKHKHALEVGAAEPEFGVAPWLFSRVGMFPQRRPADDLMFWEHQTRNGSVAIQRGLISAEGKAALTAWPFGGIPRIFMIDIASEVLRRLKRNQDPHYIDLTPHITRYVTERLGLPKSGSRNHAVLEQLAAVAQAVITYTTSEKAAGGRWDTAWNAPRVAQALRLWVPAQPSFDGMEPHIVVTADFVRLVADGETIPVRRDLLAQLAGKPLAFDVLLWLGSVTFWLDRSRLPERLFTWPELFDTFTHDYDRLDHFVTRWKRALGEAMRYYPDGNIEVVRGVRGQPGGVIVLRSPLLIAPERGRTIL